MPNNTRGPEAALALRMGQHDPAVVVAHDDADVVRAAAEDVAMEHDGVAVSIGFED